MAELHVRAARPWDAGALAALLTEVARPARRMTGAEVRAWMATPGTLWHLAEGGDPGDAPLALQWGEPAADLPETCDLCTFARPGPRRIPAGSAVVEATRRAARAAGLRYLRAAPQGGNEAAIAFYRSRGFETVGMAGNRVVMLRGA